jgi:hypothetical protein
MKKSSKILSLFFLLLFLPLFCSQSSYQKYPLTKKGIPSKQGIELYVRDNESRFISEFQDLVNDTVYDVYLIVDDVSKYTGDDGTLGYCIPGGSIASEIVITSEEKFLAYEVSMLSKYQRRTISEANNFVKGVVFHELTHNYFSQVIREMRMYDMHVANEYNNFSIIPRNTFGAIFIEEGVAEYVNLKIGEEIILNDYTPETIEEITNSENKQDIIYRYAPQYLKSFIDYYGIKKAIQILVSNPPPSVDEIFYPAKFYSRLIID